VPQWSAAIETGHLMVQNFLADARTKFAEYERTLGTAQSVAALEEALYLCDSISDNNPDETQIARNMVMTYQRITIDAAKTALDKAAKAALKKSDDEKLGDLIKLGFIDLRAACELFSTWGLGDDLKKVSSDLQAAIFEAL